MKRRRRRRRRIVRRKNIYLPTEVWMDVLCFPWTTRQKMAQMVDKIRNRWFGEQLQFYLHEWGRHTLGDLWFTKQGVSKWHNGERQPLEYPQTAMPENIKFFGSFQIFHFNNRVFNFFRRIQSVLTADNTNLKIHYDCGQVVDNTRTILGHLLPLIDGVHTLSTDSWMLPVVVQSLPAEKFNNVKVFYVTLFQQSDMQTTMEWLNTASSNEPKLLQLGWLEDDEARQTLETIRQRFMEATEPATFAVIFSSSHNWVCYIPAFTCENAIGEKLCGMRHKQRKMRFEVFRHQANNAEAGKQLRQWVDENMVDNSGVHDGKQYIDLRKPSIGAGPIFAMPDLDANEANDVEEEAEHIQEAAANNEVEAESAIWKIMIWIWSILVKIADLIF